MRTTVRAGALGYAALAIGIYLWHGLTYDTGARWEPGYVAWLNGSLALPIIAGTGLVLAFAFTGDGVLSALTGRNSSEFRDGPVGIGTVKSFRPTGLTVNDQPQIRIEFGVEGADGEVFDSVATAIVPLTELALLRPGVVLPVRCRPGRTDKVELDLSGDTVLAQRAMNEAMLRKGFTTRAKLDIAARGVAARAVVQSLSVPGEIRDGHSRVELALAVTRPDGSTFTTRAEKFLPPTAVGNVQVGRIVQVHYLPEREQEVVLAIPLNA
ncbi:hypothetical protein [Nocardia wallacei]|uniref:hypothetical protein n=1 Tax=Nocardia wallacei TaxID=480035 RepID=UPI0024572FFA|nr:hypothetical protein [Nocardia wallacei]